MVPLESQYVWRHDRSDQGQSATTPLFQFHGRARITTDEAERERVFENAPEREQKSDPERKGVAIVIDLAKVGGVLKFGPDGPVFVKLG